MVTLAHEKVDSRSSVEIKVQGERPRAGRHEQAIAVIQARGEGGMDQKAATKMARSGYVVNAF